MPDKLKRLRYFTGQFLRKPDFDEEQNYHVEHLRDHQRMLHTPGVASGLEVRPGSTATAVRIESGTAYDDLGRRIARASFLELDLTGTTTGAGAESADVYITIRWDERESDNATDVGGEGLTRFTEEGKIEKSASPPGNVRQQLLLARVARTGTTVNTIDAGVRLLAGVTMGDIEVPSVTLSSSTIGRADWVKMSLLAAKQAQVQGALSAGDIEAPSLALSNPIVPRTDWPKLAMTGSRQATLTGELTVTTRVSIGTRNIATELDALNLHTANLTNPHQTTATQIDSQGGSNQIVARINAGTGIITAAHIDSTIARSIEKLNGEYQFGSLTIPAPGISVNITNRDMRGKLIGVRGWASSAADATPSFLSAAFAARAWPPPASGSGSEAWAYCKPAAVSGTTVVLFTLLDGAISIPVSLEFIVTPSPQMNFRFTTPVSHSFGYVFLFTWQE